MTDIFAKMLGDAALVGVRCRIRGREKAELDTAGLITAGVV